MVIVMVMVIAMLTHRQQALLQGQAHILAQVQVLVASVVVAIVAAVLLLLRTLVAAVSVAVVQAVEDVKRLR